MRHQLEMHQPGRKSLLRRDRARLRASAFTTLANPILAASARVFGVTHNLGTSVI